MKINVIRGQNQVGGSIIEVSTATTKIILDLGANMYENRLHPLVPAVPGLFQGTPGYDGIFISHYHWDHTGLLRYALPDIPIYMGSTAYKIMDAKASLKGQVLPFSLELMGPENPVTIGDITLTPIACDHSAYGAFMFLVQGEGKSLLYSGDFRSTGRMNFDALLKRLPHVDALLCEGTTLSRDLDFIYPTEQELEDSMTEILAAKSGPAFIHLSAMNPERILTAYNAALRSGRKFIAGSPIIEIAKAAELDLHILNRRDFLKASLSGPPDPDFLMCIAPAVQGQIDKLSRRLSFEDGVFIFSRREEVMLLPQMTLLIANLKGKGLPLEYLHTSGHADPDAIDRFIDTVSPDILIPIHTKNAAWFERYQQGCEVIFDCRNLEI